MSEIGIIFNNVVKLVENGLTIEQSLKKLNYSRNTFYRKITKEQKVLLQMVKTSNAKYGVRQYKY